MYASRTDVPIDAVVEPISLESGAGGVDTARKSAWVLIPIHGCEDARLSSWFAPYFPERLHWCSTVWLGPREDDSAEDALVGSVSQSCVNVQSCVVEETGRTFVVGFDPREAFVVHAAAPRVAVEGGRW